MSPIGPDGIPYEPACACDCGCTVRLTSGNAMRQEITRDNVPPMGDARIYLRICANCYVGKHREQPSPSSRETK